MLISATISFECIQQRVDREGKYVFLQCKLNGLMCIIAAIYIPLPFSVAHLRSLAQFIALFPVIALGDFNNTLGLRLDRMPLATRTVRLTAGKTAFALSAL